MSANSCRVVEDEAVSILKELEVRVKGSCKLWVRVALEMVKDFSAKKKSKEKQIYGELMQIESDLMKCQSEGSKKAVRRIQELKGLVRSTCVALMFLCALGYTGGQVRVMRVRSYRESCASAGRVESARGVSA